MSGSGSKRNWGRRQKGIAIVVEQALSGKLSRNLWVKDVREEGNLFLREADFRLMGNFCNHYKGEIDGHDEDIFDPVVNMMRREKLTNVYLNCTTEALRTEFAERRLDSSDKELVCEEPKRILTVLWEDDESRPKLKLELAEWLRYAVETVAAWQAEAPDPAKSRFDELRNDPHAALPVARHQRCGHTSG
jgi:hypothetical protein